MNIRAHNLAAGDVLAMHDWKLHVLRVERDRSVAVVTAEFPFPLHFPPNDVVNVRRARDELISRRERFTAA